MVSGIDAYAWFLSAWLTHRLSALNFRYFYIYDFRIGLNYTVSVMISIFVSSRRQLWPDLSKAVYPAIESND